MKILLDLMISDFRRNICSWGGSQALQPCCLRRSMEHQWKGSNKGMSKYKKKKTLPVSNLSTTKPTWNGSRQNPVLRTDSQTTNGLLRTAKFVSCHFNLHVISGHTCYWLRDICSRSANLWVIHQDRFIKFIISVSESVRRSWRMYLTFWHRSFTFKF